MLIMFTAETVFAEVTFHTRLRIAESLKLPIHWVRMTWVREDGGKAFRPQVDVVDPVMEDPKFTQEQKDALPPIRETLKGMGVDEPEKIIAQHVGWALNELSVRLEAFRPPAGVINLESVT